MSLWAETLQATDAIEAIELFYQKGWTDGFPVIPPTQERIEAMLATMQVTPETILGSIPERGRVFTAEIVAINAVMAGCLPDYFPVVAAAVEAICDPQFGLHGPSASTAGTAILMIINGPIAASIGLNAGQNALGPGNRANATIGRALRLLLINAGGSPEFDRSTLGHPGKYTFCVAENEQTDWLPLHVQRGFSHETSTVTVFACEGPNQFNNHTSLDAKNILLTLADRMSAIGTFNMGSKTEMGVILCPEHYQTLHTQGWTKAGVQQFLYEHACRPLSDLKKSGYIEQAVTEEDYSIMVHAVPSPDDILLIVAGGEAGRFSACIPGWFGSKLSKSVTKEITSAPGGT